MPAVGGAIIFMAGDSCAGDRHVRVPGVPAASGPAGVSRALAGGPADPWPPGAPLRRPPRSARPAFLPVSCAFYPPQMACPTSGAPRCDHR